MQRAFDALLVRGMDRTCRPWRSMQHGLRLLAERGHYGEVPARIARVALAGCRHFVAPNKGAAESK